MRFVTPCSRSISTTTRRSVGVMGVTWITLLVVNWWWFTTTTNLEAQLVQGIGTQTSVTSAMRSPAVLRNELIARQDEEKQMLARRYAGGPSPPSTSSASDSRLESRLQEETSRNGPATADDQKIKQKHDNTSAPDQISWLDAIAKTQLHHVRHHHLGGFSSGNVSTLGVVYPEQWKDDPLIGWKLHASQHMAMAEVMRASWTPGTKRMYGIEDKPVPSEEGGQTVHGHWPETLSGLTYIPILKNGHTKLSNAVGDLRQRLSGAISVLSKNGQVASSFLTKAVADQKNSSTPHIVFTVVRDPIDRFISGTCQEMSSGFSPTSGCILNNRTNSPSGYDVMDCALHRIRKSGWRFHQKLQVYQLIYVASLVKGLAVTAIPFDKAIKPLLLEMGGTVHKQRDRQNDQVYKRSPGMASFCNLKPGDLLPRQRKEACELLQPDIYMMTHYLNMSVPWCDDQTFSTSPISFENKTATPRNKKINK